ncbi:Hypothetical_protein [Hexamita inflata]|uniref:Hypothetical_protein n=1 Tax=Hexamita inflata TaxID=28002 RepID=A0AA86UHY4_9EUKA|nr:Hypothetical protein HINF_LOCUS40171 [Hexamita inflata]
MNPTSNELICNTAVEQNSVKQKRKQFTVALKKEILLKYEENKLIDPKNVRKLTLQQFSAKGITNDTLKNLLRRTQQEKIKAETQKLQKMRLKPQKSTTKALDRILTAKVKRSVFFTVQDIKYWANQILKSLPDNHPDKQLKLSNGYYYNFFKRLNLQHIEQNDQFYDDHVDPQLVEKAKLFLKPAIDYNVIIQW